MKRPELITTVKALKRRFKYQELDNLCFKVEAKITDIGNPFVCIIEDENKKCYLSKLHFYVDGDKVCYINLHKLKEDDEIMQKIKNEWKEYYATHEVEEIYKSVNLSRQILYKYFKEFPMVEKTKLIKKVEDVSLEELIRAYEENRMKELATTYNTTLKYLYQVFLKKLIKERRKLRMLAHSVKFYVIKRTGSDGEYCYLYLPKYNEEKRKTYLTYVAKCDEFNYEELEKAQEKEKKLREEIDKLSRIIEDVREKV